MRKITSLFVVLLLLWNCASCGIFLSQESNRYNATYLDLFDTVTTITGYMDSENVFQSEVQIIHDKLEEYHKLYDIYNDYSGIKNIKTINDYAGGTPIEVDSRIIGLLLFCQEAFQLTNGKVDITMGSVLSIWHEARERGIEQPESAALPTNATLAAAAEHTGFDLLEIDTDAGTVRLTDPDARLDVGAVAKGYALEQVCQQAPEGLLVSLGGNIRATGPKPDGGSWVVGIQNPDSSDEYLNTVWTKDTSVVTSGDYQRYFIVDGIRYHHIIDPNTLYPGQNWRAVTVLCEDSGMADVLSTALFLLPYEDGVALAKNCGAEAMWVSFDGSSIYSEGFQNHIKI